MHLTRPWLRRVALVAEHDGERSTRLYSASNRVNRVPARPHHCICLVLMYYCVCDDYKTQFNSRGLSLDERVTPRCAVAYLHRQIFRLSAV